MSAYPLGRIDLQVTLQEGENLRSKILTFEVADFESAYNYILGRPFLKKFMAVAHFAYSVLKVPGPTVLSLSMMTEKVQSPVT